MSDKDKTMLPSQFDYLKNENIPEESLISRDLIEIHTIRDAFAKEFYKYKMSELCNFSVTWNEGAKWEKRVIVVMVELMGISIEQKFQIDRLFSCMPKNSNGWKHIQDFLLLAKKNSITSTFAFPAEVFRRFYYDLDNMIADLLPTAFAGLALYKRDLPSSGNGGGKAFIEKFGPVSILFDQSFNDDDDDNSDFKTYKTYNSDEPELEPNLN